MAEFKLSYTANEINQKLGEVDKFGGTVEITSGEPTKENTVLTIDPSAEEVDMYTATEVDGLLEGQYEVLDEKIAQLNDNLEKASKVIVADCSKRMTYEDIQGYGTAGRFTDWYGINNASAYKIGDIVRIPIVCTNKNNIVLYIYGLVCYVGTNQLQAISLGYIYLWE